MYDNVRIDSIKVDAKGNLIYTKKSMLADSDGVYHDLYIFKEDKPLLVGETVMDYAYFHDKAIVYRNSSKDLCFFDGKNKSKLTASYEHYQSDDIFDHDTLYSLFEFFM
ncbi:MAG TPA: hypothetical protein GXZ66_11030 [Clostridiaceae bacterium]|mgnify:CR=1 FL=1|jgi:hypothetical protein|nr:hypothetical protein [Clostridiaceae bacterium]